MGIDLKHNFKHLNYCEWLVLASVTFNPLLCFLTGLGVSINSSHVIFIQAFIFGLILLYALKHCHRSALFTLVITAFIFNLAISLIYQKDVSVQSIYTALVLPIAIFFALKSKVNAWKLLKLIFAISLIVSLFELFLPNTLLLFFPVGEYYFNTRDWVAVQGFQDVEGYYIGAIRPGGSYFFSNTQRVGSIFLESLGYSYFLLAFILAIRLNVNNILKKSVLISLSILLIMTTDSRVGFALGLVLSVIPLNFTRIYIPVTIYIIAIWVIAITIYNFYSPENSSVALRLSYTLDVLRDINFTDFLGISPLNGKLNDSGYLVYFSSIGIISFCLFLCWIEIIRYNRFVNKDNPKDTILPFMIVFSTTLFFGAAILSIKVIVLWSILAFQSSLNITQNHNKTGKNLP